MLGHLPEVAGVARLEADRLVLERRDQQHCHARRRAGGDQGPRRPVPACGARPEQDRGVHPEDAEREADRAQRQRVAANPGLVCAEAARGRIRARRHQAVPLDRQRRERDQGEPEQRGACQQSRRRAPLAQQQERAGDQRDPQEGLACQHRRAREQGGGGEGGHRAVARVGVHALERQQREQDREVVRQQREGGAEEVRRQREGERERERRGVGERGRAAQQAQQRQRGAVGDRHVEQPQLPQLEAHELAPAGHHEVEERGLGGRVVGEVEPVAELEDRRQLIDGGVAAVERVDLDGQALEHRDADQERDGEQKGGRGGRKRAAQGVLTHASRRRPSGHIRRSGHSAQRGARATQVRRPWRISSTCAS